jgi:5-methylcytosine-specific restriction endonuclease McrA
LRLTLGVFPAKVWYQTTTQRQHFGNNIERLFGYNRRMGRRVYDWKAVQAYHDAGHSFEECRREFGFTPGASNKAIKRGEFVPRFSDKGDRIVDPTDLRRMYDWSEVQAFYDNGNSVRECQARFGFSAMTWQKARLRGEIKPRPQSMPITRLLSGRRNRTHIKTRLLRAGLLENRCEQCGLESWRGKPLSMHIDHVNGVRDDHRLENLRMLCPNCHSQTETYAGRNAKKRRQSLQDPRSPV